MIRRFHFPISLLQPFLFCIWFHAGISSPLIPDEDTANELQGEFDELFFEGSIKFQVHNSTSQTSDKLNSKYFMENNGYSFGIRIDGEKPDYQFNPSRLFLLKKQGWITFLSGSLKIETGQGLIYGSPFGRTFRPSDGLGLVRSKWSFRPNLSALSSEAISGLLIGVKFNFIQVDLLRDIQENTATVFTKLNIRKHYVGIIKGIKNRNIHSFIFDLSSQNVRFSGEMLKSSQILSMSSSFNNFTWLIHSRILNPRGLYSHANPYNQLSRDSGERGITMGFRYKSTQLVLAGGYDIFRAVSSDRGIIITPQRNWTAGIELLQVKNGPVIEFQENVSMLNTAKSENGLIKQYTAYEVKKRASFRLTLFDVVKLKVQGNLIHRDNVRIDGGYGISARTNVFWMNEIGVILSFHLFSTDSWESRIYDYAPGMPGEFRLFALHGRGSVFNSVVKWKISESSVIQFRSTLKFKSIHLKPEIQTGIQLNIGY